jgi:poly(A) polymerase/tRNA nucleotidyltransferase (CCA-adding enzyme)
LSEVADLWAALPEARIVGGAVRDELAGRPVADIDFASPLAPEAVMARLHGAGMKVVPTGLAHGTVTAVVGGRNFEITTLRRDISTDGRHAVVAFTDDWEADAARRDFTMNAMSMDREGKVYDYFGGRADLAAGIVRFVGEARLRIGEDYLRILRFFRFFARYGQTPDKDAVSAIAAMRDGILRLSVERIWGELRQILLADDPRATLSLMQRTGILAVTLAETVSLDAVNALVARGAPVDPLLRVAALLGNGGADLAARLKLSNEELERLTLLLAPGTLYPNAGDAELRRALADTAADILIGRTWLNQDDKPDWDELRRRLSDVPRPVFPLQGRDLLDFGIPPGPRMGKILAKVRQWWLEGGCVADLAACRDRAILAVIR